VNVWRELNYSKASHVGRPTFAGDGLLRHRPACRDHALVTADKGMDIFVAHLLRDITGERRAKSTAAVHDDLRVRVGKAGLKVTLQDAFAQVLRLGGVACGPLFVFTYVEQDDLGILGELRAGIVDADLAHALFGVVDEGEKSGRVLHGYGS